MAEHIDRAKLLSVIDKCNECKKASRRISFGCQKIFMCLYLKTHKIIVKGYIALLARNSMGIIIPDYDIEKEI
jgi:hypothetical protein